MTAKFIILGANGQAGRAWAALLGENVLAFSREQVDLANPRFIDILEKLIGEAPVVAVINAAAYTDVKKAESEEKLAMRVNAEAVGALAAWCKQRDMALVHYSTDYVFGGSGHTPRKEVSPTAPMNAYGRSKLAGEKKIEEIGGKSLIFRTSWVYDAEGKNFFNTMLRLFTENEEMTVVADQFGAPTYAPELASASFEALSKALAAKTFPSGVYHLCHSGETSWHGFAQAIFTLARSRVSGIRCTRIHPISTADRGDPVKRPLNSRLDCSKVNRLFGVSLPDWEEGLEQCIKEKYGHSGLQHRGSQTHSS
jgi:dTDP-4-dehydrorhamnose reductase